eukprot:gnl/TRDRNA2_/TRDRNA2_150516_c1_seq1.p1 gnl/TRDRNA2_/TRDRNA2_150516_c1~~gnl/TRDRNA2_/TRDRNA2_150516_c1_seq1.p1  ORF type:complete len:372 (+),score=51.09 gnl/TRDRNA2_/TRDRNA2_150516_c1_seq1:120-1118(+)
MRAKGTLKHNCVAHLNCFMQQNSTTDSFPKLPPPELHASPIFDCRQVFIPWPDAVEPKESIPPDQDMRAEPLVLFEDADNIVLLKPPGWTCAPTGIRVDVASLPAQQRRDAVVSLRKQQAPPPIHQYLVLRYGSTAPTCRDPAYHFGLIHRLDLETSGPLLVAKSAVGFEAAKRQILSRDIAKDYVALVSGTLGARKSGEIRAPIDDSTYVSQAVCRVHPSGRDALTIYETIGEYAYGTERYTLLHLRLITGRTHQIRVHLAHIGHPVVCDSRYQSDPAALERDKSFCPRLFVHQMRVGFRSTRGEPVVTWSPLTMAPDLLRALANLQSLPA